MRRSRRRRRRARGERGGGVMDRGLAVHEARGNETRWLACVVSRLSTHFLICLQVLPELSAKKKTTPVNI